jgi:hypothetical protein
MEAWEVEALIEDLRRELTDKIEDLQREVEDLRDRMND